MGQRFCTILLLSLTAVWTRSSGIHAVTVVLDEGVARTIECPRPLVQRLNITSARHVSGTCESPGALQTLRARCGGEPSCTVRAGDNVFGDSCPEQSQLKFNYECLNLPGYYGCYEDDWDRALSGHEWESHSLIIQDCLRRCRSHGFKYAGVEYAIECFCGNNENFGRHGEKPMSECNLRCARDDQQFCGGDWGVEVYESSMGRPCVNQSLDRARHYVYSPDFPGLYPRSKTCEWTVRARDDRVVKINFEHFDLSPGDVITVRDGTEDSQDLTPTSGLTATTIPTVPASSGSALWVQFRSDDGKDTRGRFIFWSQEIGHCGPIPLPPDAGTAAAPYAGNVGVGETATVICNSGVLVWITCKEGGRFNDTGPYCQGETTTVSSTASSVQTPHYFSTPDGLSTSPEGMNPPNNAGQMGDGTGSTVTFIAVGVAVPLVVIATVIAAVVVCRRKRNAASKSPGSAQACPQEFTSSRVGAPPGESVGLSSLGARYVTNGGTDDPGEHLYAMPDDGRAEKSVKPRHGDRTKNMSPVPAVNQSRDVGFTENELYETADDVTTRLGPTETEAEGSVENILYGEID